jgi:hypothetical protein
MEGISSCRMGGEGRVDKRRRIENNIRKRRRGKVGGKGGPGLGPNAAIDVERQDEQEF